MVDNAISSLKQSVPSRKKKQKEVKKKKGKKEKVNKLDIGNPTNFKHKVHVGDSPFCNDDVLEETVREVYEYLNMDFQKAGEKELAAIRRKVSVYGADNIRRSMRRKSPRVLPVMEDGDSPRATSVLNGIKDARDSMRLPRETGRSTPTTVKHFDEIRRRESGKLESTEGRPLRFTQKTPSPPPAAVRPTSLSSSASQGKGALSKQRPKANPPPASFVGISLRTSVEDNWSITSNEMRRNHLLNRPNVNGISPKHVKNNRYDTVEEDMPPPLPNTSPPPLTSSGKTVIPHMVYGKPRMPTPCTVRSEEEQKEREVPEVTVTVQRVADPEEASCSSAASSASPPPPPPLPPANAGPSKNTAHISNGRQDLLQAIRSADKSSLRKVSAEGASSSGTPTSTPTAQAGEDKTNLMDILRRKIEQIRENISDSSAEENEETSDEEQWD